MLRACVALLLAAALLVAQGCKPVEKNGEASHSSDAGSTALEDVVLIRLMNSGDRGDWNKAVDEIEAAGIDAREFLLKALRFDDGSAQSARIREYAARRLGQLKAPGATVELAAALRDRSAFVRSEAAAALAGTKDAAAVPLLLEMLEGEPRPGADAEMQMFEVLRSITGAFEGHEYRVGEEKRSEIIALCRQWWAERHKDENAQ